MSKRKIKAEESAYVRRSYYLERIGDSWIAAMAAKNNRSRSNFLSLLIRAEMAKDNKRIGKNSGSEHATGDQAIAATFDLAGKAKAGKTGIVIVAWWDAKTSRKRVSVGYVGENGIKPNTWYACDDNGNLVECK